MVVIDAAFVAGLWRVGRGAGVRLWLVLVPLLGPLTFTRFDLVSAVLAGFALLALSVRWAGTSGVLAAAGAAVKLWPAGLLPALLVRRERPLRVLAGFVTFGVLAVVATLAAGGTGRLLSPLTWQSDRGLQLETIWAVPLLFARCFDSATWSTPYTRFFAFQVEGPGAGTLLRLSTVATVGCRAAAALPRLAGLAGRPGVDGRGRAALGGRRLPADRAEQDAVPAVPALDRRRAGRDRRDRAGRSGRCPGSTSCCWSPAR